MDEILQHFCAVAHLYNAIAVEDCCIGVFDTERCLVYYPGNTIDYGMKSGDLIKPGGLTHRALSTGERQVDFIPREVYGVPAMGVGFPIIKDGVVIGCVSTGMTRDKQDQLQLAAEKLSAAMEQMSATAEQLTAAASEVTTFMQDVRAQTGALKRGMDEIGQVTHVIKTVANETKLISLNAKIEAARLGDQGRAFGVVAAAISNLALETDQSLKSIADLMDRVNQSVDEVDKVVDSAVSISGEQLMGIEELTAMATTLTEEAEHLHAMAQLDKA